MRPSRTGGTVPLGNQFPAQFPLLSVDSGDTATVVWHGIQPDQWGIYFANNVVIGQEQQLLPGPIIGQDVSPWQGQSIVFRGVDPLNTYFQTPVSNAVTPP